MNKKFKKIIDKLDNKTLRWVSYPRVPPKGMFVTLGRLIEVIEPPEILEILKMTDEEINKFIPLLIKALDDPNKDWAANFVLFAITSEDGTSEQGHYKIKEWQKGHGKFVVNMWKNWWEENKGNLAWKKDPECMRGYSLRPKEEKENSKENK